MKTQCIRVKVNHFFYKYGCISVFFTYLLIQTLLNLCVGTLHYVPDELGAITAAAKISGCDWSGIWNNLGAYYGVIPGLIFTPLFLFIKNSLILYQCMLFLVTLISGVSTIYAYKILAKYVDGNSFLCFIGAIACGFMTGWRNSNVMNEFALSFVVWSISYLLFLLCEKQEKKKIYTLFIIVLLWLGLVSHTRGLIIVAAVIFVVIMYAIFSKRCIINIPMFVCGIIFAFIGYGLLVNLIQQYLFQPKDGGTLINSISMVGEKLTNNETDIKRFSFDGLRGFLDIVSGNIYAIGVSSFGMLIFACWIVIGKVIDLIKKLFIDRKIEKQNGVFCLALFAVSGLAASLLGHGVLNMTYAVIARQEDVTMSMYMYPRYFDIYWGPILLALFVWLLEKSVNLKKYSIITLISFVCISLYAFRSFIYYQASYGGDILDAWRVLYPLNYETNWHEPMYFKNYIWAFFAVIILFLLLIRIIKKKIGLAITLIAVGIIYQYSFIALIFDQGYSDFVYGQLDKTYEMFLNNETLNDEIEYIYMGENINKRVPYALQFLLRDKSVILEEPEKDIDNAIIFLSYLVPGDMKKYSEDYKYCRLDEDEIVVVKGDKYKKLFEESGYKLNDLNSWVYDSSILLYTEEGKVDDQGNIVLGKDGVEYGPYVTLPKGEYSVVISGKNLDLADFTCVTEYGEVKFKIEMLEQQSHKVKYQVTIPYDCENVEFVTENSTSQKIKVKDIVIKYID